MHLLQMSGSSESDSSQRSGGDSDRERLNGIFHKSELQDTRKRIHKIKLLGKTWALRGEITANMLHNDASMDCDSDDDAKVQNTKSQLEAVLGEKFESLFEKMFTNIISIVFFCNVINILHVMPAATTNLI